MSLQPARREKKENARSFITFHRERSKSGRRPSPFEQPKKEKDRCGPYLQRKNDTKES